MLSPCSLCQASLGSGPQLFTALLYNCYQSKPGSGVFFKKESTSEINYWYLPSIHSEIDRSIDSLTKPETKNNNNQEAGDRRLIQKLFVDYFLTIIPFVVCVLVIGYGKYFLFCTITLQPKDRGKERCSPPRWSDGFPRWASASSERWQWRWRRFVEPIHVCSVSVCVCVCRMYMLKIRGPSSDYKVFLDASIKWSFIERSCRLYVCFSFTYAYTHAQLSVCLHQTKYTTCSNFLPFPTSDHFRVGVSTFFPRV